MRSMLLSEAARLLDGELIGADRAFSAVVSDSRQLVEGALFVALRGERFDGHDFVAAAAGRGAVAALVERRLELALPQLRVADTLAALGRLGAAWRQGFRGPLVALTGSNGKTTLKEMVRAILAVRGPVLATQGNLNNHIGVPLTLLRLQDEHQYAVLEMGANHPGEIAYLTALARPDVAVVNNAGPCHLEGFGDLDGVARGKGEIFQGLGERGVAVVNADDAYAAYWRGLNAGRRILDFGLERPAAVRGELLGEEGGVRLHWQGQAVDIRLPLPGVHNVRNALAAAAAALAVGCSLDEIRQGLEAVQGVAGRLQRLTTAEGAVLINDSYNANPASLAAALATVRGEPRWLVLGDMAELGPDAAQWHARAGAEARAHGYCRLFALGEHSRRAVATFGAGAAHYASAEELGAALRQALAETSEQPTILLKGSRSMRLERIVQALLPAEALGATH
ncbi:MAG TPA: UDP-N-acetylmuramoyl-tripeptide--D-alanyl-D-alanine ligase [Candidatus Competibacteraceae bacterium]|nr:UDP-N-acetylmuramoyl-tripeptide--D-alanyl-D-alanine ligase [Candidatus Competibacteraceae bacterium]